MTVITQERIEEGLAALRADRGQGESEHFHFKNPDYLQLQDTNPLVAGDPHLEANLARANQGFDDLMACPEFFKRACAENLAIPFADYNGSPPAIIANDMELAKLVGLPINWLSARLRADKETVIASISKHPYGYSRLVDDMHLGKDIHGFAHDQDIARVALRAAADLPIREDKRRPVDVVAISMSHLMKDLPFAIDAAAQYEIGPLAGLGFEQKDIIKLADLAREHWAPKENPLSWADQMRASYKEQTLSRP